MFVPGASPIAYTCARCPEGRNSVGGLARGCIQCDGATCLSSASSTTLYIDARGALENGDEFKVAVAAYAEKTSRRSLPHQVCKLEPQARPQAPT